MFNSKKNTSGHSVSIETLIGESCTIEGNVGSTGNIRIDGNIKGDVSAEGTVSISESGVITGDVKSNELVVYGRLDGSVYTQSLHLQPNARIQGDIHTQNLHVEPGAVYEGVVSMSGNNTPNSIKTIGSNSSGALPDFSDSDD